MKIVVVSTNDTHAVEIAAQLRARSAADEVIIGSNMEALFTASTVVIPDVLIFDAPTVGSRDLEDFERLIHNHPRLAVIILCQQNAPEFLIQAMRAGVREVLSSQVDAHALSAAVQRIDDKRSSRAESQGKVLAFISCKGGSGATFLATNLGYAIASLHDKRVALIDLNLKFGDASLFVSEQKPHATIADLAQQIHRLDASFLLSSMLDVTPNFSVLAAPEDPTHANDVKPEHVDMLIRLVRRQFDFVILDIGRSLDAVCIHALDHADMIFPVLQTTLPYIRDGKRMLGVFRSLDYGKEKIHVVVNRHEKSKEITLRDVEEALGIKDIRTIPNHYDAAAASVNQGVPIIKLARSSPVSKALQDFAQALAGSSSETAPRWLSRVFNRK